MTDYSDIKIFTDNLTTLEKLSEDNSDKSDIKYMTSSKLLAVNFDAVKRQYTNALGLSEEVSASVDAFAVIAGENFLIEFKNGIISNEKNLKRKISESLLILCDILHCNISDTRENYDFILVYNESKNPLSNQTNKSNIYISNHICGKGNKEIVRFGFEKLKPIYFNEVHTYTEKEFDNFLSVFESKSPALK